MAGSSRACVPSGFGETAQAAPSRTIMPSLQPRIEGQDELMPWACRRWRDRWAGILGHELDLVAIAPPDSMSRDAGLCDRRQSNGRPSSNAECWLHREPRKSSPERTLARPLGLRLRVFDALRPVEAQWRCGTPGPTRNSSPTRAALAPFRAACVTSPRWAAAAGVTWHPVRCLYATLAPRPHRRLRPRPSATASDGLMTAAADFYRNEWCTISSSMLDAIR